jgi:hypothetical protein
MDAKTSFLNEELEHEIYIDQSYEFVANVQKSHGVHVIEILVRHKAST